jgi:hypothetical protein
MGDREAWWARVHALAQHAPHIALQIVGGRIVAHAASRLFGTAAAWGLREVLSRRSPRRLQPDVSPLPHLQPDSAAD